MPKNIGIDARLWYESGVGRYIRNLVYGFEKSDLPHSFTVFLNPKAFSLVNFENPNFKKVLSDVSWHTIDEQWRFKKELDKHNFDLVHFPYFSYPVFYKRPFIITIHDLIIDHYPTGMASSLPLPFYYLKYYAYKKIIKSAVKKAEKIIVPSIATKDELIAHYKANKDRVEVIYEGFDSLISENAVKEKLVSKNYILYVGNAYPHKNLKKLLEAFKGIRKEIDIDLVCIGRNDFFYDRYEKKIYDGVYFLHSIDDSTLFAYYTNALCLAVPSLMEGFGLPLLEAMSLSCPVVSSNTKALREIGGNACLYFDPAKVSEIENALKKIIIDRDLREGLIKKGLIQSKKFSWEKCINETLKLYESCDSIRQG